MARIELDNDIFVPVTDLQPGDIIDLSNDLIANSCADGPDCEDEDCPALLGDRFDYEYAIVVASEQETPACLRVDFEHETAEISIGFPTDHEVPKHGVDTDYQEN